MTSGIHYGRVKDQQNLLNCILIAKLVNYLRETDI